MSTTISKQDLSVYQEQLKDVQLQVEMRLSLIVPLSEYLNNFYIFNRSLFKHELKRNHNIIESFLSELQKKAIQANGDKVYHYLDISNEALEQIFLVEDKADFYDDLMLCIERSKTELKFNRPVKADEYNTSTFEQFGTYYDCLLYIITNYSTIGDLAKENKQFNFTAFRPHILKTLINQAELVSKKMKYKGNPFLVASIFAYIITKAELKEKSTVFDNEFDLILKKHTRID